jgi:hypothetical protein
VLALLLLGALLLRRRRRKPKTDQTSITEQKPYGIDTKQELDGTSYATPKAKDVTPPIAELDASGPRSDLPSSLVASHTQSEVAVELPSLAASRVVNSSVAYPQELANAVPETPSALLATHEAKFREVDGEYDIQQQIKRIREEKERLTRINELERLEAELQERLAGPTSRWENLADVLFSIIRENWESVPANECVRVK